MFNLLTDMYFINSKSGNELELSLFVQDILKKKNISFQTTKTGMIYSIIPGKPLLSAHLDQVGSKELEYITRKDGKLSGNCNLGADDKNGVWLILQILEIYPDLSFIFSTGEETGGRELSILAESMQLDSLPFGIVFDRRNGKDIIGTDNFYCTPELEKDVADIGYNFGFSPTSGVWSDADTLSNYISVVNLSCGYHKAHTEQEYTVITELENALQFALCIIKELQYKKYEKPEKYYFDEQYHDDAIAYDVPVFCPFCGQDALEWEEGIFTSNNFKCFACNTKMEIN